MRETAEEGGKKEVKVGGRAVDELGTPSRGNAAGVERKQ